MTAAEVFANQPTTTVSSGGTDAPSSGTSESWTVASSTSFPAASTGVTQFHVCDTASGAISEIIAVTNVSGTTWTVTRGAESTTPVAHSAGFTIQQVVTAGFLGGVVVPGTGTEAQNSVLAGPSTGGSGVPSFRALASSDVPTLNQNTTGTAANITDTLDQVPAPAANVSMNSHKITSLTNGAGAQDAAAYGQTLAGGDGAPMTTLGDLLYEGAGPAPARLPGGTVAVKNFLTQTGTGSVSAAPAWGTIAASDVPVLNQNTTGAASNITDTLDQVPAPSANVNFNSHKITDLAAAQSSGDAVSLLPWQFTPEASGCVADGQLISDAAVTSSTNTLTTAGVVNPSTAPTLGTAAVVGTMLAGTYQVEYTYATASGETTASSSGSVTTVGSLSGITVTAPASNGVPGGAIGVNYYFTAANGSTFFKQNATPWPFQNNYIQFAPPSTATANPPGSNTTVSAPFTAADTGKSFRLIGAGAASADLLGTVTYVSGTSVTLSVNASTTVNRNGFVWGTDNTANMQTCISTADAYAAAHPSATAEIVCQAGIYVLATAPVVGGTFGGNCVLHLPAPPQSGPKHKFAIRGQSQDVATLLLYQQMIPEVSGTCFMYIGPAGTNSATFSAASVFGTPTNPAVYVNESGTTPGFVNMKIVMDSIRVVVPWAGGIGGIDLTSAAESDNRSCSCQALGIVPSGGSWTQITANGPATNQWGWGLREPGAGNNAFSYTEGFTCEGLCYGYGPSEHLVAVDIFTAYCVTGIESYAGNGISMVHNGHIVSAGAEFCTNAVGGFDGGIRLDIDNLRTESTSKIIFDTSNRVQGRFGVRDQGAAGAYKSGWANGGVNVTLVNLMTTPGAIASPQAAPGSSVAWVNYYYLNAWMTMALSGGTFISLTMGTATPVAQPNAAGASSYALLLGAGQAYTPAYTGTLTHTVTLLPT